MSHWASLDDGPGPGQRAAHRAGELLERAGLRLPGPRRSVLDVLAETAPLDRRVAQALAVIDDTDPKVPADVRLDLVRELLTGDTR